MPTSTLQRRDGVELARTGEWDLSSGKWTAAPGDFASAIAATSCPAIRRPYLRIGHTDVRFADRVPVTNPEGLGDGEPAIGWIENLRTKDGGHTLVGDYVGVPAWLNSVMASAYPDRSIEGAYNRKCALGHLHPFVLDGLALLGVTRPGVGTLKSLGSLDDVRSLFEPVTASADEVLICASIPGAALRAAAEVHTGAMIALLPSAADAERLAVDGGEPVDELYCTLYYLGDAVELPTRARALLVERVAQAVAGFPPIESDGFSVAAFNPLGDEPCVVLGASGQILDDVHSMVAMAVNDLKVMYSLDLPENHKPWIPHVTLEYTGDTSRVAALTDRTGPITFDRVRVVFGGDATDIPLTATDWGALPLYASGGAMPNPTPSLADRVKAAWNARAPFSQYVVKVNASDVVICDEMDRSFQRVPLTVTGDDVTFGTPTRVMPDYVDYDAGLVAASVVFASRAESRPVAASDPAVEPPPDTPPAVELPPTGPVTPTTPPEPGGVPVSPAAEPEPTTEKEDHVSTMSDAMRSRLGLAEGADEAAALAAIDALKSQATPASDPQQVAAAAATVQENAELRKEVNVLAAQVKTVSDELATAKADKAATVKASVLDAAVKDGKIRPADRDQWGKDYDDAPGAITRVLASLAVGTAVPVTASGHTGGAEDTASIDDEYAALTASIDPPTYAKEA